MKLVKLTGRSNGLAKELIQHLSDSGYKVQGYGVGDINLDDTPSVIRAVQDADIFINNANYKFTQTEILYELFEVWKDNPNKHIINISSRAAQPNVSKGYLYAAQKAALEHMANNLVYNSNKQCKISTIALGLLNADYFSLSYKQVATSISTLIEQPIEFETVHLSIQHSQNYQLVQSIKAARLKNGN